MSRRVTRPLNRNAGAAANDKLYSRHQNDERPNPLFDENGNRRLLDAEDPSQADLREEWMDLYVANGGQVEEESSSSRTTTQPATEPCTLGVSNLCIDVVNACDASPIAGATVDISGPESWTGSTNEQGLFIFEGIAPGSYSVFGIHSNYQSATTIVMVSVETSQMAQLQLPLIIGIQASRATYTVILDSSGNVPSGHPLLEFEICNGPPNHFFDVQVARGSSAGLSGGPGLTNAWISSEDRDVRTSKTLFSSWSNGQTSLRLDASGNATYTMPLEWWRDLARIPLNDFNEFTIYYRILAFHDASSAPCAYSTIDAEHALAPNVVVRNNIEEFQIVDGGYIDGGVRKSLRVEFTVREPNTTGMYTIVQWMQGYAKMWQGTPPVLSYPQHVLYNITHEGDFPDSTIDSLTTNPRPSFFGGGSGPSSVSSDGRTADGTDRPGGALAAGYSHMYIHLDFETRLHLNFEVPAAVTIVRQDGSPPVYGVITGELADPQPVTLASDTWNVRILQVRTASGVTVTHPDSYAGP